MATPRPFVSGRNREGNGRMEFWGRRSLAAWRGGGQPSVPPCVEFFIKINYIVSRERRRCSFFPWAWPRAVDPQRLAGCGRGVFSALARAAAPPTRGSLVSGEISLLAVPCRCQSNAAPQPGPFPGARPAPCLKCAGSRDPGRWVNLRNHQRWGPRRAGPVVRSRAPGPGSAVSALHLGPGKRSSLRGWPWRRLDGPGPGPVTAALPRGGAGPCSDRSGLPAEAAWPAGPAVVVCRSLPSESMARQPAGTVRAAPSTSAKSKAGRRMPDLLLGCSEQESGRVPR